MIALFGISAWIYTEKNDHVINFGRSINPYDLDKDAKRSVIYESSPLEFTNVSYDTKEKFIDIKVRNNSDETTIIYGVKFLSNIDYETRMSLEPTDILDGTIENPLEENIKGEIPSTFVRAFKVSYNIPPKSADRYLINFNITADDLSHLAEDQIYSIEVTFFYNEHKSISHSYDLAKLIEGNASPLY